VSSKALLSFFAVFCAIVFAVHHLGKTRPAPSVESEEKEEVLVKEEEYVVTRGAISRGKPLVLAMQDSGVDGPLVYRIVEVLGEVVDLRKCRPGEEFIVTQTADGGFVEFEYIKDERTTYKVVDDGEKLVSLKVEPEIEKKVERIRSNVDQNLYDTILLLGENPRLVADFVEVFSWEIDFVSDVRNGDEFDMLVEKEYVDDSFIGYGKILLARYKGYFGEKWGFFFENGETGEYYDKDGHSLRRAIMRAPLSFSRISSKFSLRRYHPILKVWRPHYGVDYAAPRGTPVMAAGDGVVKFAGWKGDYGKYVKIRHPNGFQTGYGHLWKIAKGIGAGKKVKAKQIIGWVGSTGLSTGPHLQYEVIRNGKYVNPLGIKLPPMKSLDKNLLPRFQEHVEQSTTLLQNWGTLTVWEKNRIYSTL
jgi:murein DD-endopeptidase MepM/ murein hydrolase activator NlpD